MKTKELLEKIKNFKDLLQEHYNLYEKSLGDIGVPDYPVVNIEHLKQQKIQLFRLFYQIDDYLTKFSKGRMMYQPSTNIQWDLYRASIGNDVAQIKGMSMENALLELEGIIALLDNEDPEKDLSSGLFNTNEKKVFISHGIETSALTKIERFLRGLWLTPIIVKYEPSLGNALDDLIDKKMGECVAVIVLATKDDKIVEKDGKEYYQTRPNVIHEVGLAQEKVKNRIIYLKEAGCVFPSNINPKIWEDFTQENMENAFSKVTRELKAFGII